MNQARLRRSLFALLLLALAAPAGAGAGPDPEQRGGLATLNGLRQTAGMTALGWAPGLADAATAHATYLDLNRLGWHEGGRVTGGINLHDESSGSPGFTGESPDQRAVAAGYPHFDVGENVSSGDGGFDESIDGLMGAIYHRLGFLDFRFDEIGLARAGGNFVYLMGRSKLRQLCLRPPADALAVAPVDCAGTRVTPAWFDRLCASLPREASYREPWPVQCNNGQRLDADYMARFCRRPPRGAELSGGGRYYLMCDGRLKVRADWFDRFCSRPPAGAAYRSDGRYYEVCSPAVRVDAQWLERTCDAVPAVGRYSDSGRYALPCADQRIEVRVEALDEVRERAQWRNPDIVLWPPRNARDIPPAFFEEDPDPLPDLGVSGYPVSIQFNPATNERVEIERFALYRRVDQDWQPVSSTRLLSADNDPNAKLTPLQFALFPLQRLAWGGRYQARVHFRRGGVSERLIWSFSIRDPGAPLLTVTDAGQRFRVRRHQRPVVYAPPRGDAASIDGMQAGYFEPTRVDSEALDPNTARLRIDWGSCRPVTVRFRDGRSARIERRDCR